MKKFNLQSLRLILKKNYKIRYFLLNKKILIADNLELIWIY